MSYVFLNWSN